MGLSHEDVNYSMALTVCRLALNPVTGKPRNRRTLGIAIRGALLAELALAGRITGGRAPVANGDSQTDSALADAVHAAISSRRRPVPWRRWYSHTDADVDAATKVLVEAGIWREPDKAAEPSRRGSGIRRQLTFHDAYPDEVSKMTAQVFEATSLLKGSDYRLLIIGVLSVGAGLNGGRPRPRQMLALAKRRLPGALPADIDRKLAAMAAVRSTLKAM